MILATCAVALTAVLTAPQGVAPAAEEPPFLAFAFGVELAQMNGAPSPLVEACGLQASLDGQLAAAADRMLASDPDLSQHANKIKEDLAAGIKARTGGLSCQPVIAQFATSAEREISYRLVRLEPDARGARALFRLVAPDMTHYHEWRLEYRNGEVIATDFRNSDGWEWEVEAVVRNSLQVFSDSLRNSRTGGPPRSSRLEYAPSLEGLAALVGAGAHSEAASLFRTLPQELRDDPGVTRLYLIAASHMGGSTLDEAIAHVARIAPDAPTSRILGLDAWIAAGQFERALEAARWMQAFTRGDPRWLFIEGNILFQKGDRTGARAKWGEAFNASMNMPTGLPDADTVGPAWDSLLGAALEDRDWNRAVGLLNAFRESFGTIKGLVDGLEGPRVDEFKKSAEFRRWYATVPPDPPQTQDQESQ